MAKLKLMMKKLGNMRIRNKLMMAFLVVVFLPVLFVGIFLTTRMKMMAMDQSFDEAENEVERVSLALEEFVDFNVTIQNAILTDGMLYEIVGTEYETPLEVFNAYGDYDKIEEYERNYEGIEDIRVYVDNETLLNNLDIMALTDEIKATWWYQQAKLWDGKVIATYYTDDIKRKSFLLLGRYYQTSSGVDMAVMSLLSLDYLNRFVENERLNIQILDAKSQIIATNEEGDLGQKLYDVAGMYIVNNERSRRAFYKGMKSQLFLSPMRRSYLVLPIYVMSAVPLDTILEPANEASRLGFSVIFISLLAAALFIFWFSELMTAKISHLASNIKRLSKGDFDIGDVYDEEDEIGELSKKLYEMSRSLSDLMNENIAIKEKEKKQLVLATEQMKFEVLASQVNPHFLFNVLESLRMKAHMNGDESLSGGIRMLGQLMRRSLEMSSDLVTINEELEFVTNYMELQKIRFSDRIDYTVETDEVVGSVKVLPLLIQPIVENAIVHGLESLTENGLISLSVMAMDVEEDTYLMVTIADNGKGIEDDKLKELLRNVRNDQKDLAYDGRRHIGLKNVYGRIKNQYGSMSDMTIVSEVGKGTKVILKIPID